MLRDRLRRFRAPTVDAVPPRRLRPVRARGASGPVAGGDPTWHPRDEEDVVSTVAECPTCRSSMAVVEVDLVGRMARLLCGDCGLVEARRMPATAWRDS